MSKRPTLKSNAEQLLCDDLTAAGYEPMVGYQFHSHRQWAFDLAYANDAIRLAIEIDGRGRHQREQGEREDQQKINAAIEDGWRVLRYPARSVRTAKRRERIVEQVERVLCGVSCPASAACVLIGE